MRHPGFIGGAVYQILPLLFLATAPAEATGEAVMPDTHRKFFKDHCIECHDAEKQKGKVRLDDLPFQIGDLQTAERWQKILAVVNSGEMPPEDKPQPRPVDKAAFLEALSREMVVARKALSDSGGAITMRRLNRREYVNTIRDLLDVEVQPKDLPADDDGGSYDTIGSGLFFSSDQLQQYLKLARVALDEAIVSGPCPPSKSGHAELETETNKHIQAQYDKHMAARERYDAWKLSGKPPTEFGFDDEAHAVSQMKLFSGHVPGYRSYLDEPATRTGVVLQAFTGVLGQHQMRIPGNAAPGTYRVRFRAATMTPPQPGFLEIGLHPDGTSAGEMEILRCIKIAAPLGAPETFEIPVTIRKTGSHAVEIRERRPNTAEAAYALIGQRGRENNSNNYRATIWVDWMEWEGPVVESWPPRSHELLFGPGAALGSANPAYARRVIEEFCRRAFRGRPPGEGFLDRLLQHLDERLAAGEPFLEAIKTPLSIVLASPSFLYIAEHGNRERRKNPVSDIELANRLAYFLWGGPPDETLMELAKTGKLASHAVVQSEVTRMLKDEKVMRFISGFTHQWLQMVRLNLFQFNHRLYPRFDGSVKESARREVYETLHAVMRDNLPLGTLLKADFVVINDILADYYGIDGVLGREFRRVPVPPGVPRGGLPGMAAILAMGSDGERSSPVERGAWILRKLLNDPPPPAPANVPQLSRFAGKLMPARQLMIAHQEQPQCAQCHRRIDPLGFGLENFDAVGQWREQEYTEIPVLNHYAREVKYFPVDPAGSFPDQSRFNGFFQLRDGLSIHEEDFARGLVQNLIEFGLGRPCGFSDAELVEAILRDARPHHYTPQALIRALVDSKEFHSK